MKLFPVIRRGAKMELGAVMYWLWLSGAKNPAELRGLPRRKSGPGAEIPKRAELTDRKNSLA